ncbi:hypothetical protein BCR42DRAFT_13956 [Absidia repens]|uniref:Uncharacterized protein n=1 Tax=Absidia repens TaxID=90262 RepID=A0A1X2J1P8_9FUNG|nr:hypothetical protein BCR42DRAFT_13956 [Absidia repens]
MNPIMQDNGRSHSQQSTMPAPPPPHPHGGQQGSSVLQHPPYGKPGPAEDLRSPSMSGDNVGRSHALASPHSRSSTTLHHGASPRQYDPLLSQPQHHHRVSPAISHAEQQQQHQLQQQPQQPQPQHAYDMSSHHPEYDQPSRHPHASGRPLAADSHYPTRQEPLPHSPSPAGYSRSNHPAESYHRDPAPKEDASALPPPRQYPSQPDIKQEHERPLRSPHYETQSAAHLSRESGQPHQYNNVHPHPDSRRESERYDHHQNQESARLSRTSGSRATDDDYDASAADMLLSIGQSRGDKRAYPPDETRPLEDPKRLRPNENEHVTDLPIATAVSPSLPSLNEVTTAVTTTPPTTAVNNDKAGSLSSSPPITAQSAPAFQQSSPSPPPPSSSPSISTSAQPSFTAPPAIDSTKPASPSLKTELSDVGEPVSSETSAAQEPTVKETGPTATPKDQSSLTTAASSSPSSSTTSPTPTTVTKQPFASSDNIKADERKDQAVEEDEEEEGEVRDDADQVAKSNDDVDTEMADVATATALDSQPQQQKGKEDEQEEGEVISRKPEQTDDKSPEAAATAASDPSTTLQSE